MYQEENKTYTIYCNAIPFSGHAIPLLKIAHSLQKRGHHIIYATSHQEIPKLKQKYPNFTFVELHDTMSNPTFNTKHQGPPLHYFYNSWLDDIKQSALKYKPDLFFVDLFSVAAIKIAEELKIKVVINYPMLAQALTNGIPNIHNNFNCFGLTILKPTKYHMMKKVNPLFSNATKNCTRHLVLIHSFVCIDKPLSLPPNFKTIGLCIDQSPSQQFNQQINDWVKKIEQKQLQVIYVTFGSHLVASQQFVDHMYYGLKKTGKAVIWSLKDNKIPQQNQLFLVKDWLPQKDLLKFKQVKIVITHCGHGGFSQCLQAGKPMLCMPVFGDQPLNANRIQQLGLGLILRPAPFPIIKKYQKPIFTHEQLIEKVNLIVSNYTKYQQKLNKIKQIGSVSQGVDTGCDWIQYVGQYGYDHLVDKSLSDAMQRNPMTLVKTIICYFAVGVLATIGWKYYKNSDTSVSLK